MADLKIVKISGSRTLEKIFQRGKISSLLDPKPEPLNPEIHWDFDGYLGNCLQNSRSVVVWWSTISVNDSLIGGTNPRGKASMCLLFDSAKHSKYLICTNRIESL